MQRKKKCGTLLKMRESFIKGVCISIHCRKKKNSSVALCSIDFSILGLFLKGETLLFLPIRPDLSHCLVIESQNH